MAIGKQTTEQEATTVKKTFVKPYVKNTFLCIGPVPEVAPPRSMSLSPKGTCDSFSRQLHTLLYRPTPVRLPVASRCFSRSEEAASRKVCRFAEPESTKNTLSSTATTLSSTTFASSGDETGSDWGRDVTDLGDLLPATPQSLASPRDTPPPGLGFANISDSSPKRAPPPAPPPLSGHGELEKPLPKLAPRWINVVDSPTNNAVGEKKTQGSQQTEQRVLSAKELALLPSVGSAAHEDGTCKPCVFAHSDKKVCENGKTCLFCHFPHPPKKRVRLCKKKRMELKRQQMEDEDGHDDDDDQDQWA